MFVWLELKFQCRIFKSMVIQKAWIYMCAHYSVLIVSWPEI